MPTCAWGFHEHSTIATEWIKLDNTYLPSPAWTCVPEKMSMGGWADGKIPLVSMGGQAEGQVCADPWARTPIGTTEIFYHNACLAILREIGMEKVSYIFIYCILNNYYYNVNWNSAYMPHYRSDQNISMSLKVNILFISLIYLYNRLKEICNKWNFLYWLAIFPRARYFLIVQSEIPKSLHLFPWLVLTKQHNISR